MKTTKQIAKRLALDTETLRTLAGRELELAQGAAGQQTNETGCTRIGCPTDRCPPPEPQRSLQAVRRALIERQLRRQAKP